MRRCLLPIFVFLFATTKAQYVNIPDTNFRNFLVAKYPACFNASKQMDTTCGDVAWEYNLDCANLGLKNLDGIQYFKSLFILNCSNNELVTLPSLCDLIRNLDCSKNKLNTLPILPIALKSLVCDYNKLTNIISLPSYLAYLSCTNNQLTNLPALPNNLRTLLCNNNQLSTMPSLPSTLDILNCSYNQLNNLSALPDTLRTLNCSHNFLINLPPFSSDLEDVDCSYNQLVTLSTFNNSLFTLNCTNNQLSVLPPLPNSLSSLYCQFNQLNNLPDLPTSLIFLVCNNNNLQKLPALHKGLHFLYCNNNKLTSLPAIVHLDNSFSIDCSDNNIYCLPKLPEYVSLDFDGKKIVCLPNYPTSCSINSDDTLRTWTIADVCNQTNNPNSCESSPIIQCFVFSDLNGNKKLDTNELPKKNIKLSFSGRSSFTNNQGLVNFTSTSLGTYTLIAKIPPFHNLTPTSYTHNFTSYDTLVRDTFALQPTITKDSLALTITPINWRARPGFSFPYSISYENVGTTALNPTLNFSYDSSKLIYDSSSVNVTNTGNNLSLNIGNMVPCYNDYFIAYYRVKPTVPIGDSIVTNASLTASALTVTEKNVAVVTGAFDPNDKQATPELSTTQVAEGKRIDYTIRFQNTGNDTAFHVVIADTLDTKLNLNSLQMIATSHNCKTTIKDNIIYFEMRDILLPDSNVDKLGSNGFIRFSMQPKNTVIAGNNIPNKAAIYFDYNAPVITNTAITQIKNPVLPLKFISYILRQAQNDKNGIENIWTTSNEINISHFIIQRSEDGRIYKSIGSVATKGFGSYEFIDNKLPTTNNQPTLYYRLMAVDKDGSYQFSEVKVVELGIWNRGISVFPNPAKEQIRISHSRVQQSSNIQIIDLSGKLIQQIKTLENTHSTLVNVAALKTGTYFITLNGERVQFIKN